MYQERSIKRLLKHGPNEIEKPWSNCRVQLKSNLGDDGYGHLKIEI